MLTTCQKLRISFDPMLSRKMIRKCENDDDFKSGLDELFTSQFCMYLSIPILVGLSLGFLENGIYSLTGFFLCFLSVQLGFSFISIYSVVSWFTTVYPTWLEKYGDLFLQGENFVNLENQV
jgi:hypothetical protein